MMFQFAKMITAILHQIDNPNNKILQFDMSVVFKDILHVSPALAASVNSNDQYIIAPGNIPDETGLRLESKPCFSENMRLPVQE